MKAFSFRLEQALRWRGAQVDIEKATVNAAANLLADIRRDVTALNVELARAFSELGASGANSSSLLTWPAWDERMRARIQQLKSAEVQAEASLTACMQKLVEANRQFRLIENLKASRKSKWTADFAREVEGFAAESFLGRLHSKRTGA